jgi:flagellar protein FlaI
LSEEVEEVREVREAKAEKKAKPAKAKPVKLEGKITAQEIYQTLKDVLAGRAATPVVLTDDGRGRTLATSSIGVARVRIAIDEQTGEGLYIVSEPPMTGEEELLYAYVLRKLLYEMKPEEASNILSAIADRLERAARDLGLAGRVNLEKVRYYLNREVAGYGPIDVLVLDDDIEDIKCVGVGQAVIVAHRRYGRLGWLTTNIKFEDEDALADFVRRVAYKGGRGISTAVPYVDAQLPPPTPDHKSGMRFAATIGREISKGGSSFVIRKFPRKPLGLSDLVSKNTLSSLMAAYLWYVAEQKRIFFAAGPTGSGKTTLLNAILGVLDPRLSYITIEDVYELQLPTWRWTAMTTRRSFTIIESRYEIKIEDLVAMAMRMRPDYLIVGEVRTPEQLIGLLFSSTTGHGALTSIHAQDPDALLVRLLTMKIERSAIDLLWGCAVTQPVKLPRGLGIERRVVKIAEFTPGEEGVEVAEVFKWSPETDTFTPSSLEELWDASPRLQMLSSNLGLSRETILNDIGRRARFIEENRVDFHSLAERAAATFYRVEAARPVQEKKIGVERK